MKSFLFQILLLSLLLVSCGQDSSVTNSIDEGSDEIITIQKPPHNFQTGNPGFFLDSWEPKQAVIPGYSETAKPEGTVKAFVIADPDDKIGKISKNLFGNNANTYMGQMVTEPVLLDHIENLSPNVIRFPGGNLSNTYFWNAELDMPPGDAPLRFINGDTGQPYAASFWYGKNTQDWSVSLDNFYKMLEQTGNTAMFTVNYSYARYGIGQQPVQTAAKLAADWVRYDNGRTRYWEIGNENHGPWQTGYLIDTDKNRDGQPERISGSLYGEHFRVFADSMRAAANEIGADIKIGAQLMHFDATGSWNPVEPDWNEGYFSSAGEAADFYIVHDYYTPYNENSTAKTILDSATPVTYDAMEWMNTTFDMFGMQTKPVAMSEWNIFAVGSNQRVSNISGIHATMALGEMMKNSFGMAARWNFANGWDDGNDHGMFNLGDTPGGVPKWNPKPEFFYLYFFQRMFGDTMIFSWEQGSAASKISSYSSVYESGHIAMAIANTTNTPEVVEIDFVNFTPGSRYYWYTLEGGDDALFSRQVVINGNKPKRIAGGPSDYKEIPAFSATTENGIQIPAPGYSVSFLLIEPN